MDKKKLKELKRVANSLKPQSNLGKEGITEAFVDTIEKYLEAHSIMKIKVLGAIDKNQVSDMANELSQKTNSIVIDKKGFTFVLFLDI